MLKSLILTFLSILVLSWILPAIRYDSWTTLAIGTLVLSILNITLRPVLQLLFLPMNVITLGVFGWCINGAVLGLTIYLVTQMTVQPLILFGQNIGIVLSLMVLSLCITVLERVIDLVI